MRFLTSIATTFLIEDTTYFDIIKNYSCHIYRIGTGKLYRKQSKCFNVKEGKTRNAVEKP